jgi:hypothetical protein
MGLRTGLDDMQKKKILALPGLELRPHSCSGHGQSYLLIITKNQGSILGRSKRCSPQHADGCGPLPHPISCRKDTEDPLSINEAAGGV